MRRFFVVAVGLASLVGCDWEPPVYGWETERTPVVPIRNMYDQPRYDTQERQPFFEDQRSMRPQVPGTVSREMDPDVEVATGRTADGAAWVLTVPNAVVVRAGGFEHLIARGRDRYNIYCAPCHSFAGDGNGVVARRAEELGAAALKPPTLHDERLRHIPDGQLFLTITNGVRSMPAYGHSIPTEDRWAIVSYVRALQLTQSPTKSAANTRTGGTR